MSATDEEIIARVINENENAFMNYLESGQSLARKIMTALLTESRRDWR